MPIILLGLFEKDVLRLEVGYLFSHVRSIKGYIVVCFYLSQWQRYEDLFVHMSAGVV